MSVELVQSVIDITRTITAMQMIRRITNLSPLGHQIAWKVVSVNFRDVMSVHLLKTNTDKTEFIMFGAPSHVYRYGETSVRVGNDDIKVTRSVQN